MARKTKPKPASSRSTPKDSPILRKVLVHLCIAVLYVGGLSAGFYFLKQHVDKRLTFSNTPPRLVLKNRPAWMSDFLAEQIIRSTRPIGAHSSFDHQLLVDVSHMMQSSPWVRSVREIRRAYTARPGDTIEVDCDFRAPIALVKWKDYYWLVDQDGYKLPEQFTADQIERVMIDPTGKRQIRVIEGVATAPVQTGRKWPGEDLAAGLKLAMSIGSQPWSNSIVTIDVSNFAGRVDPREAQLSLLTNLHTQIKWGQPLGASKSFFVEVPDQRKFQMLTQVQKEYGRVDGGRPWIDIRFDRITYPSETAQNPPQ